MRTSPLDDRKIEAILFDKDGVLVDFQATYGGSTREIMVRLSEGDEALLSRLAVEIGVNLANNHIDAHSPLVGGCAEDICAVWADVLNIANDRAFQARVDDMFTALTRSKVVLIDNTALVVEQLSRDYHLGLATNDTEESARAQLTHRDIIRHFSFFSGYDSGFGAKPGTGMAKAFFKAVNTTPESTMMVGDSIHDMNFARAAGMLAVGVSTGPLSGKELTRHADYCVDSLENLVELLTEFRTSRSAAIPHTQ